MPLCKVCRTREAVTRFGCQPFEVEVAPGHVLSVPSFVCCDPCARAVRECDYLRVGDLLASASVAATGNDPGPPLVRGCHRLAAAMVACVDIEDTMVAGRGHA